MIVSLLSVAAIISRCPKLLPKDLSKTPAVAIKVELKKIAPDIRQSEKHKGKLDYDKGNSIDWYQVKVPGRGKLDCQVKQLSSGVKLSFGLYRSVDRPSLTEISLPGKGEKSISIDAQRGTFM